MLDFVDSPRSLLLPSIGDSNNEFKESQFELKDEENDENENDISYEELYTLSLKLDKKNRRLREESKNLHKELVSSKDELREKEELINCVESKFMISLNNFHNIKDEMNELKISYEDLKKENSNLRDHIKNQVEDIINLDSKLIISKEKLSNAQNELNKMKINCDEHKKDNLNLMDTLKRQDENINYLKSKLIISKENLSNVQSNLQTLELGTKEINELKFELKKAHKDLNNYKEIENDLLKVKNENSILINKVTQLESYKRKYECKFTQGEEKFEKLFKLGKSQRDRTGLGFDKYTSHGPKFTNTFVKGESSFSSTHSPLPKTKCYYCGKEGHFRFECKLRKSHMSKPIFEPKKVKSNSMKGKTLNSKEDSRKFKQVKTIQKESSKIDFKKTNGQSKSIKKKLLTLPPLTLEMKEFLKKVEKLKLMFKRQKEGGKDKRNEKNKKKMKHQLSKTNHQSKIVKPQRFDVKSKRIQFLSPLVGGFSKIDSKDQDLRWIPKVRPLEKY